MSTPERDRLIEGVLAGARVHGSGYAKVACPFCEERKGSSDGSRSLSYHAATRFWHCFRCGAKGRVDDASGLGEELSPDRAPDPDRNDEARRPPESFQLLDAEARASLVYSRAVRYLRGRGVSDERMEAAGIGACLGGKFAGRVVVPVLGDRREWLGFTARAFIPVRDKKLKYRYPPGDWRRGVLYHRAALDAETEEPAYVVEGAFDALAHWPHAVALLGDAQEEQIPVLLRARRPLVVVLDGDAWEKGWALAQRLILEGSRAGAVRLPPGKDPDEVDPYWLWEEARASLEGGALALP